VPAAAVGSGLGGPHVPAPVASPAASAVAEQLLRVERMASAGGAENGGGVVGGASAATAATAATTATDAAPTLPLVSRSGGCGVGDREGKGGVVGAREGKGGVVGAREGKRGALGGGAKAKIGVVKSKYVPHTLTAWIVFWGTRFVFSRA
jgi:hypothetical protein